MASTVNLFPGSTFSSTGTPERGVFSAIAYGADPSGAVDAAPIIRALIANAAAVGGGVVILGAGTFKVKSTIYLAAGVSIAGAGAHACTIMVDDSSGNIGDVFMLDSIHGCSISGLTISALSVRAAGRAVVVWGGDPLVKLATYGMARAQHSIDVDLNNQYDGIVCISKSGTNGPWMVAIGTMARQALYRNHAVGRFGIDVTTPQGGVITCSNIFIYGDATPANGPVACRARGTGSVTYYSMQTWGVQHGLLIDPQTEASESVMAIDMVDCYWDYASGACLRFNPIAGLTIPIVGTAVNTWFASSNSTWPVHCSTGTGHTFAFRGCAFLNSAGAGAFGARFDTGCTSSNFPVTDGNFGPPFTTNGTSYV